MFVEKAKRRMENVSTVLVIDDDVAVRRIVRRVCGEAGIAVEEAADARRGIEIASQRRARPDAVLLGLRLPDMPGPEALDSLRRVDARLPVIVVAAYGRVAEAMQAVRAGAFEYLTKPLRNEELLSLIKRAVAQSRAERPDRWGGLRGAIVERMGPSGAVAALVEQLEAVRDTDYSVLILGETGTGKELVARALYEHGPRRAKPFVAVDCGALVDTLVDSELFGHEKGAFTGAVERRRGRFELAAGGGVLFLDEIGNLSLSAQRSLLRALDSRTVYRVGGSAPVQLDLRVVAATNEALGERMASGSFRADLYFRLAEFSILLPPLRERPEDIGYLARRFLAEACEALGKPMLELTGPALALMRGYDWPGNARELRNVIRRVALAASAAVAPAHIASCLGGRLLVPQGDASPRHARMHDRIRAVERGAILEALALAGGNKAAAARLLGVDYKTLRTKLKSLAQGEAVGAAAGAFRAPYP